MSRILEFLLRLKSGELAGADKVVPTFAAEYDNWIVLGLAVAFLALVALTIYSYLREGNAPRRAKLTIAGIRIAVILIVFALLCQPGIILRYKKSVYSTVVVVLDDSVSMSLKDRYADAEVRRALLEKLRLSPEALEQTSRSEIVRAVLARPGGPLAKLLTEHKLLLMRFAAAEDPYTRPVVQLDVAEDDEQGRAAVAEIQRGLTAELETGGCETNLARALRQAADRVQGRRVVAIVIVSDGQITSRDESGKMNALRAAVSDVAKRHIPIYAVGVGDPELRQNVRLTQLQGPVKVRKGSDIELTAYLANSNCGGQVVELRLFYRPAGVQDWQDTGVASQVKLAGEPGLRRLEEQKEVLRHEAGQLGKFEYKVEVKPLERESDTEDNSATAKVEVSDERVKVLLVSGDGGWEFQYLRNLLLRSPERYAVSSWQQNAETDFNQEASSGMQLTQLPRESKELFTYEAVILYDPAYTEGGFDGEFVNVLEDFVSNHHGAVCYIAGNKYTELNLTHIDPRGRPGPFDKLAAMLPVVLDRQTINIAARILSGRPSAWPVLPTAVGLDHPVLRLGRDDPENLHIWQSLPGVYWSYPVIKLKPLASALAVSSDPERRIVGAGDEPAPMVAMQYYGKGRVLYLGTDESWRWRYLEDGEYHKRFWFNAVDWLASGRLQKSRVIITTGADRFSVGEKMRIRVEAYDKDYRPLEDETFVVEMVPATGEPVEIELRRDAKRKTKVSGQYEGEIPLTAVGRFELTAKRNDPDYKDLVAGKTITVILPEEERRHPEADPTTLQTMAPGENFMLIHEADRLPGAMPKGKLPPLFNEVPRDLWDVPLAIVMVVTLLGGEWILRKRYNMA